MNRLVAGVAAGGTALLVGGAVWASSAFADPEVEPVAPEPTAVSTPSPDPATAVTVSPSPTPAEATESASPEAEPEPRETQVDDAQPAEPAELEPSGLGDDDSGSMPEPSMGGGDPGSSSP